MNVWTEDREFLLACFQQNLDHMRHVENERITFFSLYLVGVGMILGVAVDETLSPIFSISATLLLLAMGAISTALLRRWNQIFTCHRNTALELCRRLGGETEDNRYFCFRNDLNLKRQPRIYIHTAQLFEMFNGLVCLIDVAVLVLAVLRLVEYYGL